jgi:chromosome segregation ATPase
MPTTTKTIQEHEAEVLRARSALLRAEAEAEELAEQLEDLETQRASVSVKKFGSRTEAVKRYEQLDRQETKVRRDIALTRASVAELEEALQEAEDAFAERQEEEREARERREREETRRKLLAVEAALGEARRALAELPGRPNDRIQRRIATVLGPWFAPNRRSVVPEPPLARSTSEARDDA